LYAHIVATYVHECTPFSSADKGTGMGTGGKRSRTERRLRAKVLDTLAAGCAGHGEDEAGVARGGSMRPSSTSSCTAGLGREADCSLFLAPRRSRKKGRGRSGHLRATGIGIPRRPNGNTILQPSRSCAAIGRSAGNACWRLWSLGQSRALTTIGASEARVGRQFCGALRPQALP
jgi:hypothetical protein